MREIKFKVVEKTTNEVIGYEFLKDGEWQHCLPNQEDELLSFGVFQGKKVNREYLRNQYTGLPDKNGKEIYEGEKCMCRMNGIETHIEEVETEVIYDLTVGAFCHKVISKGSDYKWFGLNSKNLLSCEIIGNIYQTNQIV